jgi:hypothetical protein
VGGDVLPAVDVPAWPASVPPAAVPAMPAVTGSVLGSPEFVPSAHAALNARRDTVAMAIRPTCLLERADTPVIAHSPKNSSLDAARDWAESQIR